MKRTPKRLLSISLAVIQMIRLSVNVLNAMVTFLCRLESFGPSSKTDVIWSSIENVDGELLLDIGQTCKWVYWDKSGNVSLCDGGMRILSLISNDCSHKVFREMISDYIQIVFPSWAGRIPYGRAEATIIMTKDERACFYEAGLLTDNPDPEIVFWWDNLSEFIRKESEGHKNQTGRIGERATLSYEKSRTFHTPLWMSIDSNLCGYDIKSQISNTDLTPLLIEVKASASPIDKAYFYITEREWNTALVSDEYRFYLWCLSSGKKRLAILDVQEVSHFIPDNHLSGRWELVRIPFSAFDNRFIEVD